MNDSWTSVEPDKDVVEAIQQMVTSCEVLIAVIGVRLTSTERRRLRAQETKMRRVKAGLAEVALVFDARTAHELSPANRRR